jgi:LPS sulfotransferase NodH
MNKELPFEFFIVIAEHRSGSTFFKNAISIQKDILFYSTGGLEKSFSSFGKTSDYKSHSKKRSNFRHGESGKLIVKLAHSILLKNKGDKKLFGFKCHPHRVLEIPNYFEFLKSKNARIILLTRTNALLRYISIKTHKQIRTSPESCNKKRNSPIIFNLNPLNINYKKFIQYKTKIEKQNKKVSKNISDYNLPYIHITYEELCENFNQCFDKIFDFLDLDKNSIVNAKSEDGSICGSKKINVYKLQDKILNYAEFKKAAQDNNDIETLNFLKEK